IALLGIQVRGANGGAVALSGPQPLAHSGSPAGERKPVAGPSGAEKATGITFISGQSYQNDVSPPLRDIPPVLTSPQGNQNVEHENPPIPLVGHKDVPDTVVQHTFGPAGSMIAPTIPGTTANFNGINSAGGCNGCAPPDTNADLGLTQIV